MEAVSKCLGRDDAYPDLLLRDLFDDGERGALAVYRACVAKAVAPPLAVQRAGLVYGVPSDQLGPYLAVAVDPRAHPVAIADAADRVVAKWASGVVREELVESKINKRSVLEYNRTSEGHEHPKGQRGRFVTVMERPGSVAPSAVAAGPMVAGKPVGVLARLRAAGQGEQAAPAELLAEVAPPPVAEAVAAQPRRKVRSVRSVRSVRTSADTNAAPKAGLKARLNARTKAKMGVKLQTSLQAQRNAGSQFDDLVASADSPWPTTEQYERMPEDLTLAWALSPADARALYDLGDGEGSENQQKRIVVGHLKEALGEINRWDDPGHAEHLRRFAYEESEHQPGVVKITEAELEEAGVDRHDGDAVYRYAQSAGHLAQLARGPQGQILPGAQSAIGVFHSAAPGGDWFAVRKPGMGLYGDEDEAMPLSAEFVLAGEYGGTAIRANYEGSSPHAKQASFDLDPSQRYVIYQPETLWKDLGGGRGHMVDRYTLIPMEDSESYGKAAPVLTRTREADVDQWNATSRGRLHPKDDHGQWTSRGVLARVRPQTTEIDQVLPPTPKRRNVRSVRSVRTTAAAPVATASARLDVRPLSAAQRSSLQAAIQRVEEATEPRDVGFPMALDDRPIHKVMSWKQWGKFLANHAPGKFVDEIGELPLTTSAKSALLTHGQQMTGDEVNDWSRHEVMNQIMREHNGAMHEVSGFRRTIGPADHDAWEDLYVEMRDYMEAHPDTPVLQVHRGESPWEIRVLANQRPIHDQVLIFMPEDLDPDRPITLRFVGKARQEDLNRGRWRPDDRTLVIDPHMSVYRAEQRVWRADQD